MVQVQINGCYISTEAASINGSLRTSVARLCITEKNSVLHFSISIGLGALISLKLCDLEYWITIDIKFVGNANRGQC